MVFRANGQKTRQLATSRENPQTDEKRAWGIPASQPTSPPTQNQPLGAMASMDIGAPEVLTETRMRHGGGSSGVRMPQQLCVHRCAVALRRSGSRPERRTVATFHPRRGGKSPQSRRRSRRDDRWPYLIARFLKRPPVLRSDLGRLYASAIGGWSAGYRIRMSGSANSISRPGHVPRRAATSRATQRSARQ